MTYPPDFTYPHEKLVTAQVAAHQIASLVPAHRAVVQAGGCSGLWPLALAQYFDQVFTFEPEPINFQYLQANVAKTPTISVCQAAVGARYQRVGLTRPKPGAGLWRVDGEGDVQMVPLDDVLRDSEIDAIVLDVEGSELDALTGAARLIDTRHPLLWFEYLHHTEAIDAFLAAHGYGTPLRGVGSDYYSVHTSRVQ